jgi:hypothetical protein
MLYSPYSVNDVFDRKVLLTKWQKKIAATNKKSVKKFFVHPPTKYFIWQHSPGDPNPIVRKGNSLSDSRLWKVIFVVFMAPDGWWFSNKLSAGSVYAQLCHWHSVHCQKLISMLSCHFLNIYDQLLTTSGKSMRFVNRKTNFWQANIC